MLHKRLCVLLLLAVLPIRPVSALKKGDAAGISIGIGAFVGVLTGTLIKPDPNNSYDRIFLSASTRRSFSRATIEAQVPVRIGTGLTAGLLTAGLTYWILYHSLVNDGQCKLCGDRVNSWTHFYDADVKANCGHQFRQTCIKKFMAQNGDRCPTCGTNIYNLFSTVQHVVVSHAYTPVYTPTVIATPVYTPVIVDPGLDIHVHI